jgi:hypothetical protein
MVKVTIELLPKGEEEGKRLIGVVLIANDGSGTVDAGNYEYALSHAGKYLGKRKEPYKKGKVRNFPRRYSPYRLIARVLKDAGET